MNMVANGTVVDRRQSNGDDLAIARPAGQGMIDVASTRAAQEVQAAMVIAKKFPRDETAAYQRIMQACKRPALAERAVYAYPRGGETVTGPSIRLAEVLAQSWGNIDFGIVELEQKYGESTMMSYAWDLETNTRQTKIFSIKHERHTRNGVKKLTDPRDVYELAANQGARRLRACILGVIPGDVVEAALTECDKTVEGKNDEPIAERIRKMVAAFADIGVTQAMLEGRLRHKIDVTTQPELLQLKKVYASIRDGFSSIDSFFEQQQEQKPDGGSLADKVAGKTNPAPGASDTEIRPQGSPEGDAIQPEAAASDDGAGAAPDEPALDTYPQFTLAMESHAESIDMPPADLTKLMGAVALHHKVKSAKTSEGPAARRVVYAAFVAGKLGADGKIQQ